MAADSPFALVVPNWDFALENPALEDTPPWSTILFDYPDGVAAAAIPQSSFLGYVKVERDAIPLNACEFPGPPVGAVTVNVAY